MLRWGCAVLETMVEMSPTSTCTRPSASPMVEVDLEWDLLECELNTSVDLEIWLLAS